MQKTDHEESLQVGFLEVIADYEQRKDQGETIDPRRFIEEHPDFADELRSHFELDDRFARMTDPTAQSTAEAGRSTLSLSGSTTPSSSPLPDNPIFGDYRLLERIDEGGQGIVYKARQISLDRIVAVKVLANKLADETEVARFRHEAMTVASLEHPNIVAIHEVGEQDGRHFFSMNLVQGKSLAKIASERPLPSAQAARYLKIAADAVDCVHQRAILHRDLKPSNILIDSTDQPLVTDFGLAKRLRYDLSHSPGDKGDNTLTHSGDIIGTPNYMPPEQAEARHESVCFASDVYALGATLYYLLTSSPPFRGETRLDVLDQVRKGEPLSPRILNPKVPRELETICMKCLEKEPSRRYATAKLLADDLDRFLRDEPILARPPSLPRRVVRWVRKSKRLAASIAACLVFAITVTAGASVIAVAAKREALMLQLQSIRLLPHRAGWSDQALDYVRRIAGLGKGGLRDQATGTFSGIDARTIKRFEFDATSIAFDHEGKRVVIGGMTDHGGNPTEAAKLWGGVLDELVSSNKPGAGPVTFRPDGTPVQLVRESSSLLILWNVTKQEAIGEFKLPALENAVPGASLEIIEWALARDGSLVAASAARLDETGRPNPKDGGLIAVWDVESGKLIHRVDRAATALTLSPDCKLLAAGDDNGAIVIWSLSNGEQVLALVAGRNTINCIAFGRDPHWSEFEERAGNAILWRLAAGDAGGLVTIWGHTGSVHARCHGSAYDIYAMAFNPDGTILASAGRNEPKLWDVATGRLLLDLKGTNYSTGLAFSPDGRRLAVCGFSAFGYSGGVDIWELDDVRGIQTLRGLVGQIPNVHFSPDGRFVAALSQDWQLGIWEVGTARLVRILDTPRGAFADNAAVALNPDGTLIAFSGGTEARVWEIATGEERLSITLPPALLDVAGFHDGKLLLFRVETRDGMLPPDSGAHPREHPRVCQIRNLLSDEPTKPIKTITDFNWGVFKSAAPPDGRYFIVEGTGGPGWKKGEDRWIKAFDGPTGKLLWSIDTTKTNDGAELKIDPTGEHLVILDNAPTRTLLDTPSGRLVESFSYGVVGLSPAATYRVTSGPNLRGLSIMRRRDKIPLVTVGIDNQASSANIFSFNRDGTRFAWGNRDGTVSVCDLPEVQRRLAQLGLGW